MRLEPCPHGEWPGQRLEANSVTCLDKVTTIGELASRTLPPRRVACLLMLVLAACAVPEKRVDRAPQTPSVRQQEVARPADKTFVPDGYYEKVPKLSKRGYLLSKLADGVYFFSTGAYNTMFVVASEGVVLIDPIGGKGPLLKKAVRQVSDKPIRFIVYTSPRLDRTGDAYQFSEGAQVVAHIETRNILEKIADPNRPLPNISFGTRYTLNFGEASLLLIYPGEGYGKGNIMIHLPKQKILMFAGVAPPRSVPFKNFGTVDIEGQIAGIEEALKLDFNRYVGGYFFRAGEKKEMREVLEYYKASRQADKLAMSRVTFKKVIAKSKTKDIARLFGEYYEAVAEECYRILKPDWKPRLMGFEAFARGHCDVWTDYHRARRAP